MTARSRGSVLVEGCICLLLIFSGLVVNLELVRRAQYEVVLHHALFIYTRERALGESVRNSRGEALRFLGKALGGRKMRSMAVGLRFSEDANPDGILGSVYYRYPFFWRFSTEGMRVPKGWRWRHHFEMTKTCLFRLSSSSSH